LDLKVTIPAGLFVVLVIIRVSYLPLVAPVIATIVSSTPVIDDFKFLGNTPKNCHSLAFKQAHGTVGFLVIRERVFHEKCQSLYQYLSCYLLIILCSKCLNRVCPLPELRWASFFDQK